MTVCRDERTGFKPRPDHELFISTKIGITILFRKRISSFDNISTISCYYSRCNFNFLIHINNTKTQILQASKNYVF